MSAGMSQMGASSLIVDVRGSAVVGGMRLG